MPGKDPGSGDSRSAAISAAVGGLGPVDISMSEMQCERLLVAALQECAARGATGVTVEGVVRSASLSRSTFFKHFRDAHDCVLAAVESSLERAGQIAQEAYERQGLWQERVRAGLSALLSFLEHEPAAAQVLIVPASAYLPWALGRRGQLLDALAAVIEQGRGEGPASAQAPPLTGVRVVDAALGIVHDRLSWQARPQLQDLANPLMAMIVLPYLGPAAARRELVHPKVEIPPARPPVRSLEPLPMRLAYRSHRMMRALLAIVEHPGRSNREVAAAVGIANADSSQISKMLARLESRGAISKQVSSGPQGSRNLWTATAAGERAAAEVAAAWSGRPRPRRGVLPLYGKLPSGTHKLTRKEVVGSQRRRIYGGLLEAVARYGYAGASVEKIIGLAGVSSVAFYELFDNKEDCFCSLFDLQARRLTQLVADASSKVKDPKRRQQLAMRVLVNELDAKPRLLRFLLVDALALPTTTRRLGGLLEAAERWLDCPAAPWMIGGLYRVLGGCLRAGRVDRELPRYMLDWGELLAAEANHPHVDRRQAAPWPRTPQLPLTAVSSGARLEESAINLALSGQPLTMRSIAAHAGFSSGYRSRWSSANECVQTALDTQGQQLIEAVADPTLLSNSWSTAVHHAIGRATAYLATHAPHTTMLGRRAHEIGLADRALQLADRIATLLTVGAPRRAKFSTELISGAISRTLVVEVGAGRGHRLQDHNAAVARMVLAPHLAR